MSLPLEISVHPNEIRVPWLDPLQYKTTRRKQLIRKCLKILDPTIRAHFKTQKCLKLRPLIFHHLKENAKKSPDVFTTQLTQEWLPYLPSGTIVVANPSCRTSVWSHPHNLTHASLCDDRKHLVIVAACGPKKKKQRTTYDQVKPLDTEEEDKEEAPKNPGEVGVEGYDCLGPDPKEKLTNKQRDVFYELQSLLLLAAQYTFTKSLLDREKVKSQIATHLMKLLAQKSVSEEQWVGGLSKTFAFRLTEHDFHSHTRGFYQLEIKQLKISTQEEQLDLKHTTNGVSKIKLDMSLLNAQIKELVDHMTKSKPTSDLLGLEEAPTSQEESDEWSKKLGLLHIQLGTARQHLNLEKEALSALDPLLIAKEELLTLTPPILTPGYHMHQESMTLRLDPVISDDRMILTKAKKFVPSVVHQETAEWKILEPVRLSYLTEIRPHKLNTRVFDAWKKILPLSTRLRGESTMDLATIRAQGRLRSVEWTRKEALHLTDFKSGASAWSPDGSMLAVASNEAFSVQIYDTETIHSVMRPDRPQELRLAKEYFDKWLNIRWVRHDGEDLLFIFAIEKDGVRRLIGTWKWKDSYLHRLEKASNRRRDLTISYSGRLIIDSRVFGHFEDFLDGEGDMLGWPKVVIKDKKNKKIGEINLKKFSSFAFLNNASSGETKKNSTKVGIIGFDNNKLTYIKAIVYADKDYSDLIQEWEIDLGVRGIDAYIFFPNHNEHRNAEIIVLTDKGTIIFLKAKNGRILETKSYRMQNWLSSITNMYEMPNSQSTKFAFIGEKKQLFLWDALNGNKPHLFPTTDLGNLNNILPISDFSWAPDGKRFSVVINDTCSIHYLTENMAWPSEFSSQLAQLYNLQYLRVEDDLRMFLKNLNTTQGMKNMWRMMASVKFWHQRPRNKFILWPSVSKFTHAVSLNLHNIDITTRKKPTAVWEALQLPFLQDFTLTGYMGITSEIKTSQQTDSESKIAVGTSIRSLRLPNYYFNEVLATESLTLSLEHLRISFPPEFAEILGDFVNLKSIEMDQSDTKNVRRVRQTFAHINDRWGRVVIKPMPKIVPGTGREPLETSKYFDGRVGTFKNSSPLFNFKSKSQPSSSSSSSSTSRPLRVSKYK